MNAGQPVHRIGLNLLYLAPGATGGTETYARELIPALRSVRPHWEFVAFIGRGGIAAADVEAMGAEPVQLPVPSSGRFLRVLGEQLVLPRAARRCGIDLLHNLGSTGPRFVSMPQVTTTHDVIYASHPEAHSLLMRVGQSILVPAAARASQRVITISEASASEIVKHLDIDRGLIDVIPNAAGTSGTPAPEAEVRARFELGDAPLLLATSARRGHKNLGRLLEAVERLRSTPPATLVLPGYASGAEAELTKQIEDLGLTERVKLLGWIDQRDLDGLYGAAELLVFPSLAEGFGLPVLEAMQHGLPVATSKVSAMPEVGGEAAIYFDPYNVDEIADTIDRLLGDSELRAKLRDAGRLRAAEFSWEHSAELTAQSFERVLGG